jgi:hypothetical protein
MTTHPKIVILSVGALASKSKDLRLSLITPLGVQA